jgi:hypothetical protein
MTHFETKAPFAPWGARDADGVAQLVVHQQRERAVAVVEGAEPVRNADHPVRPAAGLRNRVTGGEDRLRHDPRF